jgi:hypothetical protein
MPRKKRSHQEITTHLSNVCEGLYETLSTGNLTNLTDFSIPLRSIIAEFQQDFEDKNTIDFSRIVEERDLANKISQTFKIFLNWLNEISKIKVDKISSDNTDIGILLLETNLPLRWTTQEDFIFIDYFHEHKDTIIKAFKKIKQQHLYLYRDEELTEVYSNKNIKIEELKSFLRTQKMSVGTEIQVIGKLGKQLNGEFVEKISKSLSNFNTGRNTVFKFEELWNTNQLQGYGTRLLGNSHEPLMDILCNQNILVISPGPSLKYSIDSIKKSGKENFTIIATAQAMPALNKYKITPDFVMVSDPTDYSQVLDETENIHQISFIGDESVHPSFISKNFKAVYTIVSSRDMYGLAHALSSSKLLMTGGTVSLRACELSVLSGASSITVVGQDLAFSGEAYFFHGEKLASASISFDENHQPVITETDQSKVSPLKVLGWNGEELTTKSDYNLYLNEFERFSEQNPSVKMYNCSIGGARINGFDHQSLDSVLTKLDKKSKYIRGDISRYEIIEKKEKSIKFLSENIKIIKKFQYQTRLIITSLVNKKSNEHKMLTKVDKAEKTLIKLAKQHNEIGVFFQSAQIELQEQVQYVKSLQENIKISIEFYKSMYKNLILYSQACEQILKEVSI